MKTVYVRVVILNLNEVAMCGAVLPAMEVSDKPGHGIQTAVTDVIRGTHVEHCGPIKLVGVYDLNVGIDIVYRVRTRSRALNPDMHWQNVDAPGYDSVTRAIDDALRAERT